MRTYDEKGRRVPQRRAEAVPRANPVLVFACGVLLGMLVLAFALSRSRLARAEEEAAKPVRTGPTHDSMTITYDYQGEATRYYVMTDPDTQVQYVVNDRGGMCPRLDRNGDVMGVSWDDAS